MKIKNILCLWLFLILISFSSASTIVPNCQVLSTPNTEYILNQSIVNDTTTTDCIRITAQNVSLDCLGYSIISSRNLSAINTNQQNTTIKNCNITIGGSSGSASTAVIGIEFIAGANDGFILNNIINSYLGYSIFINGPDRITITNNTAISNRNVGIRSIGADNTSFNSNTASSIINYALGVDTSAGNTVTSNIGTSNTSYGINLDTLKNVIATNNNGSSNSGASSFGIYVVDVNNITFNYNRGTGGVRGIYFVRNTNSSYFTNIGSGDYGLYWNVGSSNNITNNTGIGGTSDGINFDTINNDIISFNNGSSNSLAGIYTQTCTNNTFLFNIGTSNLSNGLFYQSVSNSTSTSDIGISNIGYGIYSYSSSGNIFINPTAKGQLTNSYGFAFRSSNNNLIKNCINVTGVKGDVLYITTASTNNTFLNCTYRNETIMASSTLIRKWYYQGYANFSNSNPLITQVNATNRTGGLEFNTTTSILGFTPLLEITDYVNNAGTKIYYSPYNMTATYLTHLLSHTLNISLGSKYDDYFAFTDTTPPVLNIVAPINEVYNKLYVDFNYTVSDDWGLDSCWYKNDTDGGNITIPCGTNTTISNVEGWHTIHLWANDTSNNIAYTNITYMMSVTIPAVNLRNPKNAKYLNSGLNLQFNFTGANSLGVDTCFLYVNWTGGWLANQSKHPIVDNVETNFDSLLNITSDGVYMWNVMCNDTTNIEGWAPLNYTFTIDTIIPQISIISPASGTSQTSKDFSVNITFSDLNLANATIYLYNSLGVLVNYGTSNTSSFQKTFTGLGDDTYYFNATVLDLAGNQNSTETRNITIYTITPPSGGGGGAYVPPINISNVTIPPINITYVSNETIASYVAKQTVKAGKLITKNTTNFLVFSFTLIMTSLIARKTYMVAKKRKRK